MARAKTINRKDFVCRFMRQVGLTHAQSCRLFDAMCDVFKDGVVNGSKVRIGKLGVLQPRWHEPKAVHKGFEMGKGGQITRKKHVYFLDRRISYRLRIYSKFMDTHSLHWYDEHWPIDDELKAGS